jgi:hypothetical protein
MKITSMRDVSAIVPPPESTCYARIDQFQSGGRGRACLSGTCGCGQRLDRDIGNDTVGFRAAFEPAERQRGRHSDGQPASGRQECDPDAACKCRRVHGLPGLLQSLKRSDHAQDGPE